MYRESFAKVENLVDMNALFGFLVKKVGARSIVDPETKADPMQGLIDLYLTPGV